jgi:hypothetical protein
MGCERGDSNPHRFPYKVLNLARLPIPPLSLEGPLRPRLRGYLPGKTGVGKGTRTPDPQNHNLVL